MEDSSPLEPKRIFELFCRPTRFFTPSHALARQPELFVVIWLTGIARVQDRFDVLLSRSPAVASADTLFVPLTESWAKTWVILLLAGLLAGGLGWLIGGWWYGVRLHLSGAHRGYEREGRLTWAYVALVSSLPGFLLLLIDTLRYDSYYESYHAPANLLALVVVALILWSPWISYRAATTRFQIEVGKARFWFFVLPLTFQVTMLVLFGVVAAMKDGV